jgi:hypothetical protein
MMTETAATKPRRFALPNARGAEWASYTLLLVFALAQLRTGHHILEESKGDNWVGLFLVFSALTFQRLLTLDVLLRPALWSLGLIWAITACIHLFF